MNNKIQNSVKLSKLPVNVISREPFILLSYWQDFIDSYQKLAELLPDNKNSYFIFQLGWHRETVERVNDIKESISRLSLNKGNYNLIFLANSEKENELLESAGLESYFCHQNAFLDEKNYKVISNVQKLYDAIYVARITPFKRHYLAADIKNLLFVGNYSEAEKEFCSKTIRSFPNAVWKRKVRAWNIYKVINQSKVGLCLSKEEGAMFVSAEYLLSGVPVVNTPNIGGRDHFLTDDNSVTVDDNPKSVAEGVQKVVNMKLDPEVIRSKTIERFKPHREKFINIVQQIYDREKIDKQFSKEWNKVFCHKLGLRCSKINKFLLKFL